MSQILVYDTVYSVVNVLQIISVVCKFIKIKQNFRVVKKTNLCIWYLNVSVVMSCYMHIRGSLRLCDV